MVDKLIGTAPQQVPTNADLGNAAYQDMDDIFHRGSFFKADTAESEAGSDDAKYMTPSLVHDAFLRYGLKTSRTLPASTDLNTVVDSGFYRMDTVSNGPATSVAYGQLIVSRGIDTILQIASDFTGAIHFRNGNPSTIGGPGAWSTWCELQNTANGASTGEAQTGTNDTKWMSAKKLRDVLHYLGVEDVSPSTASMGYGTDLALIDDKTLNMSLSGTYTNGPLGVGANTYTGQLKVFRRNLTGGASVIQELTLSNNVLWKRTGTGAVGAVTWDPWVSLVHSGYQGAGSGIDSDKVDGLHATSFMRTDQDSSSTGYQKAEGFVSGDSGDTDKTTSVAFPAGGSSDLTTTSNTGAIKIVLPVSWTSTMLQMTVSVFDWATHESFKAIISGYNNLAGTTWLRTSVQIIGSPEMDRDFTVRFGHDGSKCCVYIGELADVWDYPQITVENVMVGYSGKDINSWHAGWSVGFEASAFGTITSTHLKTQVGRYIDGSETLTKATVLDHIKTVDGAGSGLDADLLDGLEGSKYGKIGTDNYYTANQITINNKGFWGRNLTNTTSYTLAMITADNEAQLGSASVPLRLLSTGTFTHNGNVVWCQNNDGAGSGLDADLLDGLQASQFARVGTTAPDWGFGYTRANTSDFAAAVNQRGTGDLARFFKGATDTAVSNASNYVTLTNAGDVNISGSFDSLSDRRIKTNIELIPNSLDKVCALNGVTYDRTNKDRPKRETGLIAQEVLSVLPEAVNGGPTEDDPDALYTVSYGQMMGLMVEAIKELRAEVNDLREQLNK